MAAAMLASASGQLLASCQDALNCLNLSCMEEFREFDIEDQIHSWPKFETFEELQPLSQVDAFMTNESDLATIPHSLTFMAGAGRETVPSGMCVVDTAALIGCGGDRTLDRFIGSLEARQLSRHPTRF